MTDPKARAEEISAALLVCIKSQDFDEKNRLMSELRTLAARHPESDAVVARLAMWLSYLLEIDLGIGKTDTLDENLDRLRELSAEHPLHEYTQRLFAFVLHKTAHLARAWKERDMRDGLQDELQAFAASHAAHPGISRMLANSLLLRIGDAKKERKLRKRRAALEDLRDCVRSHRNDASICGQLSLALVDLVAEAQKKDDQSRSDDLLDELRALAAAHADDSGIADILSTGLFTAAVGASKRDDRAGLVALLDELRPLARAHSDNPAVLRNLAQALVNAANLVRRADDPDEHDRLLDELRTLVRDAPPAPGLSEQLEYQSFDGPPDFNDLEHWSKLAKAEEESQLKAQASEDLAKLQITLARGLLNALKDTTGEVRDRLLDELRDLCRSRHHVADYVERTDKDIHEAMLDREVEPGDQAQSGLSEALYKLFNIDPNESEKAAFRAIDLHTAIENANRDGHRAKRDRLLEELRALSKTLPLYSDIQEEFAKGLFESLVHAGSRKDSDRNNDLLYELESLAQEHSGEKTVKKQRAKARKRR